MKISTEGLAINKRFFHTIDVLARMRVIRGLQTFTRKYNINYWNITVIKKEPDCHAIKTEWLSYLVTDYGVSAKYLLTGVGNMFEEQEMIQKAKAMLSDSNI